MQILTDKEFTLFKDLIYNESGIDLNSSKKNLVQARLQKRLREKQLDSFTDYYNFVTNDPSRNELINMIDCISTNKTHFYRESKHFDILENQILPELIKEKQNTKDNVIRIWSAGCSTGEEPYTLAMILYNLIEGRHKIKAKILGTDISTNVLNRAIGAKYDIEQMKDLPPNFIKNFFTPLSDGRQSLYTVKDCIKSFVTLRKLNFLELNTSCINKFDIIFCRNVMIYFDFKTRYNLIKKFYNLLTPKGHFFLSHSETLAGHDHRLKFIAPAAYVKY